MADSDFEAVIGRFRDWGETRLGRAFLAAEQEAQHDLAAKMFGYYFLQLGQLGNQSELQGGQFRFRLRQSAAASPLSLNQSNSAYVLSDPAALAISTDSMAAVSLGHVLDFHHNPHQVLREVDRVLIPGGYVLLSGFNTLSSWRLWQMLRSRSDEMPWSARFVSLHRLGDWLGLLNLEIINTQGFFYRPPLTNQAMLNRMAFVEKWDDQGRWGLREGLGAGYVLLARKRAIPMTPIRPRWQPSKGLLSPGVVEPSTRDVLNNKSTD